MDRGAGRVQSYGSGAIAIAHNIGMKIQEWIDFKFVVGTFLQSLSVSQ